ncbi:MAG: LCP family protein [Dermatophilaceae bacterium]|nr:LCP family protein [Dermatophilaceae bacterium]
MAESRSGGRRPVGDSEFGSRSDATRRNGRQAYRRAHRHPWVRRGSIVAAAGLASLLVLGVMGYLKLNSNITRLDITKILGKRPGNGARADSVTNLKPLNILVMGSDSRELGTTRFGTTPGGGSDTMLVLHLSGDRKSAVVVSIPRDSMTKAPRDCKDPNSTVAGGPLRMWNANFNVGGPACVIRTLEWNTGIFVDHFMVVDFLGFQSMVEALGSVEFCVPTAVDDPKSHLKLPAGRSRVRGDQALAFVRVGKNIGADGSDLGRINRQQAFLAAMVQEATSSKLLLRPDKLVRFLIAATSSLTLDKELGTNAMREVAQSAVGLKTSQVKFVTVPNEPWSHDHNRVQRTSAADALWKSIRDDAPLPGSMPPAGPRPGPAPTDAPALTVRPDRTPCGSAMPRALTASPGGPPRACASRGSRSVTCRPTRTCSSRASLSATGAGIWSRRARSRRPSPGPGWWWTRPSEARSGSPRALAARRSCRCPTGSEPPPCRPPGPARPPRPRP